MPTVTRLVLAATLIGVAASCAEDPGTVATSGETTPVTDTTVVTTVPPTGPTTTGDDGPTTTGDDGPTTTGAAPSPTTSGASQTTTTLAPLQALAYEPVTDVSFPSVIVPVPDREGLLVAERGGAVRPLLDGELGDPVLDLSGSTTTESERGLLGLTFHPSDPSRLFVHYTDGSGDTTVSELAYGQEIDPASERVLLTVDQPAANHNGGMIQFGPDGALYLGLGDGGAAGDRFGNGQNTDTLLGGIVRIDVDSGDRTLWQYGLRNPWRFWIDGADIWIGDVGQDAHEEVDVAPIGEQGINYGWPITEGASCYRADECDTSGFTMPIVDVPHGDAGTCSITGGLVYRGADIPEMEGRFFFSDYCGGFLRSTDASGEVVDHTDDVGVAGRVVSFGVDAAEEMYVLTTERILRVVPVR